MQWARSSGENWGCKNLREIEETPYGFSECEVNKVKIIRLFKRHMFEPISVLQIQVFIPHRSSSDNADVQTGLGSTVTTSKQIRGLFFLNVT